jgi:hypothetical protein
MRHIEIESLRSKCSTLPALGVELERAKGEDVGWVDRETKARDGAGVQRDRATQERPL